MKRPLSAKFEPIHILREWAPRGVIHVGANDGEEFVYYKQMGIKNLVGFEPLATPFKKFKAEHPDVLKFQLGWSDLTEKKEINVTENDKASSVLMTVPTDDWTTHPVFKDWNQGQWPIVSKDIIQLVRYEDWVSEAKPYNTHDYNFLNMDVQGLELEALKGMGTELNNFDVLVIECSQIPVYIGESSANVVSAYLREHGFERITEIRLHGDILFIRKDLLDD